MSEIAFSAYCHGFEKNEKWWRLRKAKIKGQFAAITMTKSRAMAMNPLASMTHSIRRLHNASIKDVS